MRFLDRVRWNLSTRGRRRFSQADGVVISVPKSGRTWVRYFLSAYISHHFKVPFQLEDATSGPRIAFTHDLHSQFSDARLMTRLKGKHVVPQPARSRTPLLIVYRDPRDVIVSHYFQVTKRREFDRFSGTLPEYLRHPRLGMDVVVRVMNEWAAEFEHAPNARFVAYEGLRTDPVPHFRQIVAALLPGPVDEAALQHAIEASKFEQMKKVEAAGSAANKVLAPGDSADPESFKVRKGSVGGWRNYLKEPADLELLANAVARLHPRYGYRP